MPQDYYDSEDTGTAVAEMPADEKTSTDDSESPVEVVSKEFFMGKVPAVGDRFTAEVTQVNEDSCLVKKVDDTDKEGTGDETSGPEEEGEMGDMMGGSKAKNLYE